MLFRVALTEPLGTAPAPDGKGKRRPSHLAHLCLGFERAGRAEGWEDGALERKGLRGVAQHALYARAGGGGVVLDTYADHQGCKPRWRRYALGCLADFTVHNPDGAASARWTRVIAGTAEDLAPAARSLLGRPLFARVSQVFLDKAGRPERGDSGEGSLDRAFESAWSLDPALTGAQGSAAAFAPLVALAEEAVCLRASRGVSAPASAPGQGLRL